jgi:hypothetical protein
MPNRTEAARENLTNRHREVNVTAPLLDSTQLAFSIPFNLLVFIDLPESPT